ncbi:5E5 antigen-like [Pteropus medius]|uniref:5E5 antigen-like n=1 Tax=Pteropus vampyrus TaxID=132908 RepID=UPI00196AB2C0|nr:5E5 antigen-like [Pteropus giganteus]
MKKLSKCGDRSGPAWPQLCGGPLSGAQVTGADPTATLPRPSPPEPGTEEAKERQGPHPDRAARRHCPLPRYLTPPGSAVLCIVQPPAPSPAGSTLTVQKPAGRGRRGEEAGGRTGQPAGHRGGSEADGGRGQGGLGMGEGPARSQAGRGRRREQGGAGARRGALEAQLTGRGRRQEEERKGGELVKERSSRVTSPTRRRGHRRRRRHFNRAFGLRSALSARAKEPTRSTSRSHSSASRPLFTSRPPTSPSAHTPHTPHPAAAGSPPSLSSSVWPPRPRPTPSSRSPTPPSPDLLSAAGRERRSQCHRGGSPDIGSCSRHRPSNIHFHPPLFLDNREACQIQTILMILGIVLWKTMVTPLVDLESGGNRPTLALRVTL